MAVYFQNNNISAERTGVTVNVPNNDVARLMYYLNCVCTSINCNDEPEIQRFTNYRNWSYLSVDDQKALVVVCYTFSPDIFDNKVFFQSDALCGDRNNEFYTINQVRNQVFAAETIVIAGQQRVVNKIMTYKMQWMRTYYLEPMRRLAATFSAPPPPRAVTYTAMPNRQTYSSTPTIQQPYKPPKKRSRCCVLCSIFFVILIIIGVIIGVIFLLRHLKIVAFF